MIICPNCGNQEMVGALFCKECGTQFTSLRDPTVIMPASLGDQLRNGELRGNDKVIPSTPDDARISLYLVETGEVIPLEGLTEFTLGRSSEDQPILPDIDLASYHAYEYGVSRLHASIQLDQPYATLTDFGSANGTQLNGQKMTPNKPYPITHGDIISLGKMKIQVLINR
jgi:pSer/pThr/pTyr-binding forkhead associated (FHA) protein